MRKCFLKILDNAEQMYLDYDFKSQSHKEVYIPFLDNNNNTKKLKLVLQLKEQIRKYNEQDAHKKAMSLRGEEDSFITTKSATKLTSSRSQGKLNKSAIHNQSQANLSPNCSRRVLANSYVRKSFGDLRSVKVDIKELQQLANSNIIA